jgi:hypothetical protein
LIKVHKTDDEAKGRGLVSDYLSRYKVQAPILLVREHLGKEKNV